VNVRPVHEDRNSEASQRASGSKARIRRAEAATDGDDDDPSQDNTLQEGLLAGAWIPKSPSKKMQRPTFPTGSDTSEKWEDDQQPGTSRQALGKYGSAYPYPAPASFANWTSDDEEKAESTSLPDDSDDQDEEYWDALDSTDWLDNEDYYDALNTADGFAEAANVSEVNRVLYHLGVSITEMGEHALQSRLSQFILGAFPTAIPALSFAFTLRKIVLLLKALANRQFSSALAQFLVGLSAQLPIDMLLRELGKIVKDHFPDVGDAGERLSNREETTSATLAIFFGLIVLTVMKGVAFSGPALPRPTSVLGRGATGLMSMARVFMNLTSFIKAMFPGSSTTESADRGAAPVLWTRQRRKEEIRSWKAAYKVADPHMRERMDAFKSRMDSAGTTNIPMLSLFESDRSAEGSFASNQPAFLHTQEVSESELLSKRAEALATESDAFTQSPMTKSRPRSGRATSSWPSWPPGAGALGKTNSN
jgi:hypothetical protein